MNTTLPLKLTIELVPEPCWYSNMRKVMSQEAWDTLRRQVYREYGYRCAICGAHHVQLHCHERWSYDDVAHVQRLDGYICLCVMCHHCKHIGLAGILADEGKLDYQAVVDHFCSVNGCTEADFERHREEAFAQWRERNRYAWRTDLGQYAPDAPDTQA